MPDLKVVPDTSEPSFLFSNMLPWPTAVIHHQKQRYSPTGPESNPWHNARCAESMGGREGGRQTETVHHSDS